MADVYYESLFLSGYNRGTNLNYSDSKSLTRNSSNKFENFEYLRNLNEIFDNTPKQSENRSKSKMESIHKLEECTNVNLNPFAQSPDKNADSCTSSNSKQITVDRTGIANHPIHLT